MACGTVIEAIGAGPVAQAIHKSADENVAIRKEIGTVSVAFTIRELADESVTEIAAFRPVDINAGAIEAAIRIGAEKYLTILVEVTAETVKDIGLEAAAIDIAAELAGWLWFVDADAAVPYRVQICRAGRQVGCVRLDDICRKRHQQGGKQYLCAGRHGRHPINRINNKLTLSPIGRTEQMGGLICRVSGCLPAFWRCLTGVE